MSSPTRSLPLTENSTTLNHALFEGLVTSGNIKSRSLSSDSAIPNRTADVSNLVSSLDLADSQVSLRNKKRTFDKVEMGEKSENDVADLVEGLQRVILQPKRTVALRVPVATPNLSNQVPMQVDPFAFNFVLPVFTLGHSHTTNSVAEDGRYKRFAKDEDSFR